MTKRKYRVVIAYTQEKEITVWAEDEAAAEEKACEIVEGWNGVLSADATDVEEA